ncbi:MAG: VOC family protein [Sandaracinus sp.]
MADDRLIFVNLPVRDLARTQTFFRTLGFAFNPKFTDEKAACMIVSDKAFVMLLAEPFFKTFTDNEIADTRKHTEALICISCPSREAVDRLVKTALEAGGRKAKPPQDHGFMYGWSFYDVDGHHWEVMWMDPAAAQ